MKVNYDPSIIQEHARQLYDRALGIIVLYALVAALPAFIVVWGLVKGGMAESGLAALLAGLLGAAAGRARAFELRLQAQLALCQARIETNTEAALRVLSNLQAVAPAPIQPQHHAPQPVQGWGAQPVPTGTQPGYPAPPMPGSR